MPRAAAGHGLTPRQRLRRTLGRHLASRGFVEVISNPFGPAADADRLGLPPGDPRRSVPQIANPIKDDEPLLRGTLLPGLLRVLIRNTGRGFADVALFELGKVFLTQPGGPGVAPILAVDHGPTVAEAATLDAALPDQPLHLGVVLAGDRDAAGWWGKGRPAGWQDAIEARPPGAGGLWGAVHRSGRPGGAVAPGPVRGAVRDGRPGPQLAGGLRGRTAPAGDQRVRAAAPDLRGRAGHVRGGDRAGRSRAGPGPAGVRLPGGDPGCVAVRARRGAVRRGGRRAGGRGPVGRRVAAGGHRAVRRVHRRAGRRGPQVAELHAAVPRRGPDADRGGGQRGPGGGGRRGGPPHRRSAARRLGSGPSARAARPLPSASGPAALASGSRG